MDYVVRALRENPELAVFLTLAVGFLIGRLKIGSFSLGTVVGTLLAGVVIGQLNIKVPSGCTLERPTFSRDSVSVTGLEALARCPFRFYGERVAGWQVLEPLSLTHDLDALARGSLLHKLLEEAVKPYLAKRSLAEIAAEMLKNERAALWSLAQKLPQLSPEAAFALVALPDVFRKAAQRQMVEMAAAYFEWAKESPTVPQAVEQELEKPFPDLAGLQVVGKIDRIDLNGETAELID